MHPIPPVLASIALVLGPGSGCGDAADPPRCGDADGDGVPAACRPGQPGDCDDASANAWTSCASCEDADGDGVYAGCDAYVSVAGPDCFDEPSTPAAAGVALSELRLPATFASAGVHVTVDTALPDVTVAARFCRQPGDARWEATRLYPVRGSSEHVGSLLWLDDDTPYEVEVVATSASTGARAVLHGALRTRRDAPPAPAGGTVYVGPMGDDAGPGTATAPFATVARAVGALGPAVTSIELLPGVYREAVVLDAGPPAGAYYALRGRPGAVFDGADAAIQAGVTWTYEPATDTWSFGPLATAPARIRAVFAERAGGHVRLYPHASLASLVGAAIPGVAGGFFHDVASATLHVRLPDGGDPATATMHVAVLEHAVHVDRVSRWVVEGLELRHFDHGGLLVRGGEDVWIRGNTLRHGAGILVAQPYGQAAMIPARAVIEDNEITDVGIWDWGYAACKARACETTGIVVACSPEHVIRRNVVDGTFNGIAPTGGIELDPTGVPRCGADGDTYDNVVVHVADDGIEVDGPGVDQRVFRNVVAERHTNGISLSPLTHGPTFVLRNVVSGWREAFVKLRDDGDVGWKVVAHNTALPDPSALGFTLWPPPCFDGLEVVGNVLVGRTRTLHHPRSAPCSPSDDAFFQHVTYDANQHWSQLGGGLVYEGTTAYADLAAFRAATGHELHGLEAEPTFELDGATPTATSPGRDAGVVIPGINDRLADGAPDLGAIER